MFKRSILSAVVATGLMIAGSSAAFAQSQSNFDANHPRRAEVNQRLENQNVRVKQEVREGEMSRAKARRIHQQDRRIRKEERRMAAENGGHITKTDQRVLNHQENKVSSEIGR